MRPREIFQKAYALMDEPVTDGDCGLLCGRHCCRETDSAGERMGIYLLPQEYEAMLRGSAAEPGLKKTRHTGQHYDLPPGIDGLWFVFCDDSGGCLRELRPIQCRTYPFEPHYAAGELSLVVLQEQIHGCPLLDRPQIWRPEFIKGVFEGWRLLMQLPQVKQLVAYDSRLRRQEEIRMEVRL